MIDQCCSTSSILCPSGSSMKAITSSGSAFAHAAVGGDETEMIFRAHVNSTGRLSLMTTMRLAGPPAAANIAPAAAPSRVRLDSELMMSVNGLDCSIVSSD